MSDIVFNSSNVTNVTSDLFLYEITSKLQQALLWLQLPIGLLILSVNLITLFVLYKTDMHQEALRVLFGSMALSDAIVGLNYTINCFVRQYSDLLTAVTCGFRFVQMYCVILVSMGNVALLALDRCIVLSFPYRYMTIVTARRTLIASILLWMFCIILGCLSFSRALQNFSVCLLLTLAQYREVFLTLCSFFGMILIMLIVCYTIICHHVRIQIRKIARDIPQPQPIAMKAAFGNVDSGVTRHEDTRSHAYAATRKPKLSLRFLKTVTFILGWFMLCYTPIVSLFAYILMNPLALQSPSTMMMLNSSFFLMSLNSIVNPILYTWKTRQLQLKFLKLFCSFTNRCQAKVHNIQQQSCG